MTGTEEQTVAEVEVVVAVAVAAGSHHCCSFDSLAPGRLQIALVDTIAGATALARHFVAAKMRAALATAMMSGGHQKRQEVLDVPDWKRVLDVSCTADQYGRRVFWRIA